MNKKLLLTWGLLIVLATWGKNLYAQTTTTAPLEQDINQAIIKKQWDSLEKLLPQYWQLPHHDVTLWQYATGALAYHRKDYKKAIRVYRQMIADNPTLVYPRFDLAIMLFEDKQLTAAENQFRKVKAATVDPTLLKLSDQYLQAIQQANTWQFDFSANYTVNDNVNNASSSPTITVGNVVFTRTKDSLPKTGHGINYALSASRDWNVTGAHYLSSDFRLSGDYYWDAKDYQQTQVRADVGYRYKSVNNTFTLRPFVSTLWYGGQHYTNTAGIGAEVSHWLNRHWRLGGGITVSKQRYMDKDYQRYNSENIDWRGHITYIPSAKQYWQIVTDIENENANDRSESQRTNRIRLGWGYEWSYGISSRLGLSYAKREHKAAHYLYRYRREDKTQQAELTLWKRDWHLWGLTPKLTYLYQKTDSNIPDLYNRKKSLFFLSVEKSF